MADLKKKKSIDVKNSATGKEYHFTFVSVGYDESHSFDCEKVCKYYNVCHLLPDPRGNERYKFLDFCGIAPIDKEGMDQNYIPQMGTLEENFKDDEDIMKILFDSNPSIPLRDFSDKVCKTFCDDYEPTHSKCTGCNANCILAPLLKNANIQQGSHLLTTYEFNTGDKGYEDVPTDTDSESEGEEAEAQQ